MVTGVEPAGGAALGQVAIATAMGAAVTVVLLWLCAGHRSGRSALLAGAAGAAGRATGLPGWYALPLAAGGVSLQVALLGMYWDIALHIDRGRDAGPLANPAHYLILAGLFGIFAAGVAGAALPAPGERPGPRPLRVAGDWHAPAGAVLVAACGAFALVGFPLDDVWHRLFGQDVTLWGPTHLMLIGGAAMSLIGLAVLSAEGLHDRRRAAVRPRRSADLIVTVRRAGLTGGLLIGLSTFQAEFDFGVPQFRLVFQPLLIAFAAAFALTAARRWIGPGGALGAVAFFWVVRGLVSLIVGPVLGEVAPALPLYLGEAVVVEAAALVIARPPLAFGALAGALCGTAGLATEWAWTQVAMPLPWTASLLPEAVPLAAAAGTAGGTLGALLAAGLRGELPRRPVARAATVAALLALALCVTDGLAVDHATRATAAITLDRDGSGLTARIEPDIARDAAWATVTAWQGGGRLHLQSLRRTGPGLYRADAPVPLTGDWKALLRVHAGRAILGVPIRLPDDPAIPAAAVAVPRAGEERAFSEDTRILQRERKHGVEPALTTVAPLVVLALALALAAALACGVGRVGRALSPARRRPPRRAGARPAAGTPLPR